NSSRAPLPLAEVVVRASLLRDRRIAVPHSRARSASPGLRKLGLGRRALRTGSASALESRLLPFEIGRRTEPAPHGRTKPKWRPLPDAHAPQWQADIAHEHWSNQYHGPSR